MTLASTNSSSGEERTGNTDGSTDGATTAANSSSAQDESGRIERDSSSGQYQNGRRERDSSSGQHQKGRVLSDACSEQKQNSSREAASSSGQDQNGRRESESLSGQTQNGRTEANSSSGQHQNGRTANAPGPVQDNGGSAAVITRNTAQLALGDESGNAAPEAARPDTEDDSNRQNLGESAAEALSDSQKGRGPQPGSPGGSQRRQEAAGEEVSNIDGTKGKATGTDEDAAAAPSEQNEEDVEQLASGKVSVLKQRLVAAAKEAKAGTPDLLKVMQTRCLIDALFVFV